MILWSSLLSTHAKRSLALLAACWLPAVSAGGVLVDIQDAVRQAAMAHAATGPGRFEVSVTALDPRLSLSPCATPIETQISRSTAQGRLFVRAHCAAPKTWSLIVPVEVRRYLHVVVAKGPIARGTPLTAAHLQQVEHDISRLPSGYFRDLDAVIGAIARRNINAQEPLSGGLIQQPTLVKRGDEVLILAQQGAMQITGTGVALSNGGEGDQVRIRSAGSDRVVYARVVGDRQVEVALY
ncbi:MAG: flagellar basal body P-ring formation chaperone FlgA [Pseudomonadota bacterium]|nr:flagellar basal body P-ring formation chaperone FlgA [Pseudomonadota bacterium]